MTADAPVCRELRKWLKANLGPKCLAPLTSTDSKALDAAVHIVELYAFSNPEHEAPLIQAFGIVVSCMQPSTMELAYHSIAHVLEWRSRSDIWAKAGLPKIPVRRCLHEPRPTMEGAR